MHKVIFVPISIVSYECGPPTIAQCPDCSFNIEVVHPAVHGVTDGEKRNECRNTLNSNQQRKYRAGICIFFKEKEALEHAFVAHGE